MCSNERLEYTTPPSRRRRQGLVLAVQYRIDAEGGKDVDSEEAISLVIATLQLHVRSGDVCLLSIVRIHRHPKKAWIGRRNAVRQH